MAGEGAQVHCPEMGEGADEHGRGQAPDKQDTWPKGPGLAFPHARRFGSRSRGENTHRAHPGRVAGHQADARRILAHGTVRWQGELDYLGGTAG